MMESKFIKSLSLSFYDDSESYYKIVNFCISDNYPWKQNELKEFWVRKLAIIEDYLTKLQNIKIGFLS